MKIDDRRILVNGGYNDDDDVLASMEVLDIERMTFSTGPWHHGYDAPVRNGGEARR